MFADACNKAKEIVAEMINSGNAVDLTPQDNPFEGSDFECDIGGFRNGYWVKGETLNIIYEARWWIILMVCAAVSIFITKALAIIFFSRLGEKLISGVRKELYQAVIRKQIGWHDNRDNASGIVTATLASDV